MRTQSMDTSPEAERVLIALLRQKGVAQRYRLTAALSRSVMVGAPLALRQQKPELTEQEAMFSSFASSLGQPLVNELRQVAEQRGIWPAFSTIDLGTALFSVIQALEQTRIPCALTGSLACCLYGMQQAQVQADILANLENADAAFLQELLPATFYVRLADIHAALANKLPITYYHLPSLFRIQLAFPQAHLDELSMLKRTCRLTLVEGRPALPVLAPEDTAILTLIRVQQSEAEIARRGRKEQADDIWNELLGLLKVQGSDLDLSYIEQRAFRLGLLSSINRALQDAGLS